MSDPGWECDIELWLWAFTSHGWGLGCQPGEMGILGQALDDWGDAPTLTLPRRGREFFVFGILGWGRAGGWEFLDKIGMIGGTPPP